MSLKSKFLLPTVLLFTLGLAVISVTYSWSARSTLQDTQERNALEITQAITANVSNWLNSVKRDADIWSTRNEFIEFAPNARASLKRLHAANPLYAGVSLLGMDGTVVYSTTEANEGKLNLKERDYVQTAMKGNIGISDLNISKVSGLPVVAVAAPLKREGSIVGAIYMTINIAGLTDHFFKGVTTGESGYMMMFNSRGGFLSHPQLKEMNQRETTPPYITNMLKAKEGIEFFKDDSGREYMAAFTTDSQLGWVVAACFQIDELYADLKRTAYINIGIGAAVLAVAVILIFILVNSITTPLKNTVAVISELAEGEGDLTTRLTVRGRDEVGMLATELNRFIEKLWGLVSQIKENSVNISNYAEDMNRNNGEINERTQQQAGALEETSSALEQMTSSVRNNAASAREANVNADETYKLAQQGGEVLNKTMVSMREVTEASQKIKEITNVVNEIAFQTNLLALNAAVEAARAGEAGKGFAVVAGEVRNLASRSASAAGEIQTLIADSVDKIQVSNNLVLSSDEILKAIIKSIQQANATIAEISSASSEQSSGIGEISNAVQNMDQGVQRNSQMVSDNFTLSTSLSQAARELVEMVSRFKL